jgi:hypothetical protein
MVFFLWGWNFCHNIKQSGLGWILYIWFENPRKMKTMLIQQDGDTNATQQNEGVV